MNAVESTWQSRVHGIVEQLADGLATGQDEKIRRRIRGLADDLMRKMLRAVCGASAKEIAEAVIAFEGSRAERAAVQQAASRASQVRRSLKAHSAHAMHADHPPRARYEPSGRREREPESRGGHPPPSQPTDPFDITMPSELLASTEETKQHASEGAVGRASSHGSAGVPPPLPRLLSSPTTSAAEDAEAESERRPKVVLREGEHLLKGTGSGVVIRRERRVKP